MNTFTDGSMHIQTTSESSTSPPSWFGEVVVISRYLHKHGVLAKITEQVRFARRRFGRYEVIDFLAVLFGYAISGERTLEAFYQRLQPFAVPFMALFERDRLPSRSALSRFLAAVTEAPVEALRTLFLDDLSCWDCGNRNGFHLAFWACCVGCLSCRVSRCLGTLARPCSYCVPSGSGHTTSRVCDCSDILVLWPSLETIHPCPTHQSHLLFPHFSRWL